MNSKQADLCISNFSWDRVKREWVLCTDIVARMQGAFFGQPAFNSLKAESFLRRCRVLVDGDYHAIDTSLKKFKVSFRRRTQVDLFITRFNAAKRVYDVGLSAGFEVGRDEGFIHGAADGLEFANDNSNLSGNELLDKFFDGYLEAREREIIAQRRKQFLHRPSSALSVGTGLIQ